MSPTHHHQQQRRNSVNTNSDSCEDGPWQCSTPLGCIYNNGSNAEHILITRDDLRAGQEVVTKVICSNEQCNQSPYMHTACFQTFEESVLCYLKGHGRAKSWSERQKLQNLWTKKAYDLVFKACACNCAHGHLRKDLDWCLSVSGSAQASSSSHCTGLTENFHPGKFENSIEEEFQQQNGASCSISGQAAGLLNHEPEVAGNNQKRKRKKSKSQSSGSRPTTITIGLPTCIQSNAVKRSDAQNVPTLSRNRTNSVSSITSGSSFGSSNSGDGASVGGLSHSSNEDGGQPPRRAALLHDRSRHDSGGSIFMRRMDYSSFNVLPKQKINSYHIKMEDECSIGNDETRIFILSNLASNKMNKVPCVLCKQYLTVFDRYPLIDGTFFLSPRQHNRTCVQVKIDGKASFLTPVCMHCLEGWTANIGCKFCGKPWTGGHLILGTMYSYDIFAAVPCCPERLKCNNCKQLVIHPDQRFSFFSDYSQIVSCPHCGVQEAHFAKNLPSIFAFLPRRGVTRVNSA